MRCVGLRQRFFDGKLDLRPRLKSADYGEPVPEFSKLGRPPTGNDYYCLDLMKRIVLAGFILLAAVGVACGGTNSDFYPVQDFGAHADGKTDDTAAFQKALDTASQAGGGVVYAARGNYYFTGHLNVPRGVILKGVWESVPAHTGLRNRNGDRPTDDGTTFMVTENQGNEDGAPFITLHDNATLKGVVLYYPDQKPKGQPTPYPWAIAMRGANPAVISVELLNPYNGIDASHNERHLIRDVQGQPLRRGVYVDAIYDIGRIENVHFNPWWSYDSELIRWQEANGEAFIFGRSDWQYVYNTFCFAYGCGYKFIKTKTGVCNGNFLGIGADDCNTAVKVEDSAPFGLLISNGEFTSFHGDKPTMVRVETNNVGTVRFVNCAFWGPCRQIANIAGRGTVGFSDCTFVQWDGANEGCSAIEATGGSVLIRGCEFKQNKPHITLGENVRRAVISDNLVPKNLQIVNHSKVVLNGQNGNQ